VSGVGGGLPPDAVRKIGDAWRQYGQKTPLKVIAATGPTANPVTAVHQPPPAYQAITDLLLGMKKPGPIFPGARPAPLPIQPLTTPPSSPTSGSNPAVNSRSSGGDGRMSPTPPTTRATPRRDSN
jgi:hypothetical protein